MMPGINRERLIELYATIGGRHSLLDEQRARNRALCLSDDAIGRAIYSSCADLGWSLPPTDDELERRGR